MKKPVFAALLALLYCVSGAAQNTNEWHTPKGLPSGNEIGVRYGAQLFMGDGRGPEFEAISIDYARYNYYNIGFRTGLNLFFDDEVCDYYSIPMQFTWRTERIRGLVFPGDGAAARRRRISRAMGQAYFSSPYRNRMSASSLSVRLFTRSAAVTPLWLIRMSSGASMW